MSNHRPDRPLLRQQLMPGNGLVYRQIEKA